jgi:protein-L-isoaspartate O-methyltransferase
LGAVRQEGTAESWEYARSLVAEAIDRDGSFLDVGCANGYLMECLPQWTSFKVEPFGLEIAPELAALARQRLPQWTDRIWSATQ